MAPPTQAHVPLKNFHTKSAILVLIAHCVVYGGRALALENNNSPHHSLTNPDAIQHKDSVSDIIKKLHNDNFMHQIAASLGNYDQYVRNYDDDGESSKHKRPSFSSWGGKRDLEVIGSDDQSKRAFSSWGGKRASTIPGTDIAGKRARFNSWGGKRARFSSWGGKRSQQAADGLKEDDLETEKRRFNSWGGKRNTDKRPSFSSWGGKRSSENNENPDKRASFNSWGGKRARFSSWGGKRADSMENKDGLAIDTDPSQATMDAEKRARFNSWGGKRAPSGAWEYSLADLPAAFIDPDKRKEADDIELDGVWQNHAVTENDPILQSLDRQDIKQVLQTVVEDLTEGAALKNGLSKDNPKGSPQLKDALREAAILHLGDGSHHGKNQLDDQLKLVKKRNAEKSEEVNWKRRFSPWAGKRSAHSQQKRDVDSLAGQKSARRPWMSGQGRRLWERGPEFYNLIKSLKIRRSFGPWRGKRTV